MELDAGFRMTPFGSSSLHSCMQKEEDTKGLYTWYGSWKNWQKDPTSIWE